MDLRFKDSSLICQNMPTNPVPDKGKILVTGATGYIGGRLVPELLARGYKIRILVRSNVQEMKNKWPEAEIFEGNALDSESMNEALKDIWLAYYLIHSFLLGKGKYKDADVISAMNFRNAAVKNNVERIVYLGGLGVRKSWLSPHLKSRLEVARTLKDGPIAVTVLRAAVIIGSGSASYEIIKNLIKNLPILFIPPWARTRCQPISIRDVIKYLIGVIEIEGNVARDFDIGGPDILSYEEMLKIQAEVISKNVRFVNFPFNVKGVFAYFVSILTPVPVAITRCLMGSVMNEVVCNNFDINNLLPFIPISYKESLLRALSAEERDSIRTRWSDSFYPTHSLAIKLSHLIEPPTYKWEYSIDSQKSSSSLFATICKIGGDEGWSKSNWIWRLRRLFDRRFLGVGMARIGKKNSDIQINDVIDFWRVEDIKSNRMLLIRAEMKIPGKAWLKFDINQKPDRNIITITAFFDVKSIFGKLYWYCFLPLHYYVFTSLAKQIDLRS